MKLTTLLLCVYKFCSPTSLFKYIYIYIHTQQQGCQFHNTKSFSPIFISRYMGMSKNENEARIYTGGRESARIFLRASSSHYTTIRMYGAVEKCGKQHMRGMQYQNKHVIKLSVRLQLEQPQHLDVLLLPTQLWPQTTNVQRLQCESVRAVPGWCDDTSKEAHQGAAAVQAATGLTALSRVCSGTAFPSCVVSRIFPPLHTFLW